MPGGTHDEVRTRAGFVVLLGGVRRLPRAELCAYVHNMCEAVAAWMFLRCIRFKCTYHLGRYMR